MRDFTNAIAFITGGASGAGLGQALVFGRAGARVAIADVRQEAIDAALAQLAGEGIEARGYRLDVTDRAAYAAVADAVERDFGGPPTLLFNTAGVNSFGPVSNATFADFDWIVGVNLGGVINGMVTFVPRMIAAGRPAHIVSVSSMGGLEGAAVAAPYSAAKAAVINLMESYRGDLARFGIGVSVVCPANIRTNIADATKLRPEHLGASGFVENDRSRASLASIHQHGMDPVELAEWTKQGVEADQLYIIPYPEVREQLRAHYDAIIGSVLPIEADPEGARTRVEALQAWQRDRAKVFGSGTESSGDRKA